MDNNFQHDAARTLTDLRDHLARHDKPIAFFFGAGTSCSIWIPTIGDPTKDEPLIPAVAGLTKTCENAVNSLGGSFEKAWGSIVAFCEANGQDPNIESILSRVRMMLSAVGTTDTLAGLDKAAIERFEECIRKTIAEAVSPDLTRVPDTAAHHKLAGWIGKSQRQKPVEIFTVNYDVLFEHAIESAKIPLFDGFVGSHQPFFHSDSVRRKETAPGPTWTRLWKMHGSVNWQKISIGGRTRVVRGQPNMEGEMIFPSYQKYDESRQQPYSAYMDRLTRFLEQDDALLVAAGFSFSDEHLNNLVFTALDNKPRTHVYSLQFDEIPHDSDLFKQASSRSNLIVLGPKSGIIGGKRAVWKAETPQPFMSDVFELVDEEIDDGGTKKTVQVGKMKIGDFSVFCDFLSGMETRDK